MTELSRKTNGDMVAPFADRAKASVLEVIKDIREHPDEAAVRVAPVALLALATARHKLNFSERVAISQCGYWSGYFAVQAYRQWKDKPAGTVPRLRKVN